MKILKLYILKEFIPPYVGSMAFFTMLLLLERVMSFVRLVARGYASIIDLMILVFFSVPPTLALTMPMSTIMGALIAVSRLSNDSEITAMRASGIRLNSIFVSLYITGVCIGIISFFLTDRLVPVGNIKFRTLYQRLTLARPDMQINVHSINKITGDITLLVDRVDDKTGDLMNVTIFQRRSEEQEKTISAQRGWFLPRADIKSHITLRLSQGSILDTRDITGESFNSTIFKLLDFNIPLGKREMKNVVKTPRDMSMKELKSGLTGLEKGSKAYNVYLMEYNKKIAIPFACLLFVFLGTPFAVKGGRTGKGLGLGIGVLVIFFYYIFLLTFERIGKRGVIHPALAVWLPNIIFFITSMANLIRRGRT